LGTAKEARAAEPTNKTEERNDTVLNEFAWDAVKMGCLFLLVKLAILIVGVCLVVFGLLTLIEAFASK